MFPVSVIAQNATIVISRWCIYIHDVYVDEMFPVSILAPNATIVIGRCYIYIHDVYVD